jgi:hypothetical protein
MLTPVRRRTGAGDARMPVRFACHEDGMHGCGQIGWRHVLAGTLAAAVAGCPAPATAAAANYTVAANGDGGSCAGSRCDSIRAALEVAEEGDTIRIPPGDYALDAKLGPLQVANAVRIEGAGPGSTIVHPAGTFTVFETNSPRLPAVIAHLTVSGGSSDDEGGNLHNAGLLVLDHVRVTAGSAASGGGVANDDGTLVIDHSLLDGNRAANNGGAVYDRSIEVGGSLAISDSTITGNAALVGGGVATAGGHRAVAVLERVTVARNTAGRLGGGVSAGADGGSVDATGTIVADNTASASAAFADIASDCAGLVEGDGTNLETAGDCGFATQADPQLSAELDPLGGETPVLALARTSPAIGLAGHDCGGTDQRDVPRPQGPACDAGAYELAAPPDVTTASGGASSAFTFSSRGIATFECSLDGGTWESCTSPHEYAGLPNGDHVFSVRVPGGEPATQMFSITSLRPAPRAPTPTPTPIPTPTPTPPPPHYHRSVVVRPVAGTVKIRLPGTRRYVVLDGAQSIPLGASIDVRHGRIRLTSARSRSGKTQAATFYSGVFKVTQRGSYTELTLGGPPVVCSSRASASSKHTKRRKHKTRRLWGRGSGRFRTRGQYSAATVRGTTWLVQDSCRGTLTRVVRGVVAVRDRVRHRTILLRAHKRYLARPRRR